MAREISAGGVVLRRMRGQWWIAAIEPRRNQAKAGSRKRKVLALPKGVVDPGEKPEETALREVREESGVDAELVGKLGDIKYVYVRSWGDGERVFKVVSFYLFMYRGGKLGDIAPNMQHEVTGAEWVPLDEAHLRISYGGERQMVKKAQEWAKEHANLVIE